MAVSLTLGSSAKAVDIFPAWVALGARVVTSSKVIDWGRTRYDGRMSERPSGRFAWP